MRLSDCNFFWKDAGLLASRPSGSEVADGVVADGVVGGAPTVYLDWQELASNGAFANGPGSPGWLSALSVSYENCMGILCGQGA